MVNPAGLRERKKSTTRRAIRREAFRLFEAQGFGATTVEQIAEAADVSTRTFYRYFRVKESVLLSDDHIPLIVDAFVAAPRELTPVAAYRHAVATVYQSMSAAERGDAVAGQRLMYGVPEAHGLIYDEYVRLVDLITEALASRMDASVGCMERRVIAGAIVGVLIAVSHDHPHPADELLVGLDHLESVLRIPGSNPVTRSTRANGTSAP